MIFRPGIIGLALLSAALSAVTLHGAPGDADESYRLMVPAVSVKCSSVYKLSSALSECLSGIGFPVSENEARLMVAGAALLPDVDFADGSKPAYQYFLTRGPENPSDEAAIAECAVLIPLSRTGKAELLESLTAKYAVVSGKGIRVCKEPLDETLPEVVYFAAVEGNALVSTSLNGIRWLALNQRDRTLPVFAQSSDAPLEILFNGPLAGRLFREFSNTFTNEVTSGISLSNIPGNANEIASFVENFSSVSLVLKSGFDGISITLQLDSPRYSDFDIALRKLKTPDDSLASLVPDFAENPSVSSSAGFLAALPAGTRRWLSLLSLDVWFSSLSLFPAVPELDSAVFPSLSGESVSMFVADKSTVKLGNVSFYSLADPAACSAALKRSFAKGGTLDKNSIVTAAGVRNVKSVPVYQYDVDFAKYSSQSSNAGGNVSDAADMRRVEAAVWNGKLAVAFGRPGLIDLWLSEAPVNPSSRALAHKSIFDEAASADAVYLGGGSIRPVETLRRLFFYVDSLMPYSGKLPHSGNGFFWSLSRRGSSAVIQLRLSNSEILACRALGDVKSEVMRGIVSRFIFNSNGKDTSGYFKTGVNSGKTRDPASVKGDGK